MRTFIYLTSGLGLLFFALQNLPYVTMDLAGVFTVTWLLFAMLFIGANLYDLIGVDREHRQARRADALRRAAFDTFSRGRYQVVNRGGQNKRRFMQ